MNRYGWIALAIMLTVTAVSIQRAIASRDARAPLTRRVGVFPNNMVDIIGLISRTDNRLVIIADHCAYGGFSAPQRSAEYQKAIADVAARKPVDLHIYDPEIADKMIDLQLGFDRDPAAAFETLRKRRQFGAYFEYHSSRGTPRPVPTSSREFQQLVRDEQARCIEALHASGAVVKRDIKAALPVFMWIRDNGDEAVMSLYNLKTRASEVSLISMDKQLVNLLLEIANNIRFGA
jgi:hypothetical protein